MDIDLNGIPPAAKEEPKFRWLSGWSRIFLDMLAITFGVLLAFGLSTWWESKSQEKSDQISMSQVYQEIDRNFDSIEQAYQYRLELYPKMLAVDRGLSSVSEVQFEGIRPPKLETAAYNLALSSGVFTRAHPEKAQSVIRTYLNFENINNVHDLYGSSLPNLIFAMENPNDPKFARFMSIAFMDMIFAEGNTLVEISENFEKPAAMDPFKFVSETSQSISPTTETSKTQLHEK